MMIMYRFLIKDFLSLRLYKDSNGFRVTELTWDQVFKQ